MDARLPDARKRFLEYAKAASEADHLDYGTISVIAAILGRLVRFPDDADAITDEAGFAAREEDAGHWVIRNYHRDHFNVAQSLLSLVESVLDEHPYFNRGGPIPDDDAFVSVAQRVTNTIAYAHTNSRVDSMVRSAAHVDRLRAVRTALAEEAPR